MHILAILEHLQKIPFYFSLFLPVILFFLFGLAWAYWLWFRYTRRLELALTEHAELTSEISDLSLESQTLGDRFTKSASKITDHSAAKLRSAEKKIASLEKAAKKSTSSQSKNLEQDHKKHLAEIQNLGEALEVKESRLTELETELTGVRAELATKVDLISELRERKISELESGFPEQAEASTKDDDPTDPPQEKDEKEDTHYDSELGLIYRTAPDEIDDLKRIKGIANVLEGKLHDFGVYRFQQIIAWTPENISAFSDKLSFHDRIQRDDWISQAEQFEKEKAEAE